MSVRDISLGDTFDHKFTTRQFSDGVPTTAVGLVVSIYPDNSITETVTGVTTTFTSGFDSRPGLVNVRVVATSGNGYVTATDYAMVVTAGTVGGVSIVGEVVGHFTIGRSAAATRIGLLSATAATGDPGTTTGLVAYMKQLVNVLIGTNGITTWAAGAAPANAVSMSESLRYISENIGAVTTAAATGDPNTAKTGMGYLKQLVNVLIGTDGIATFPAEAAPGNAVSLAEVIRAVHADVTGLNGDVMRGTDGAATPTNITAGTITTVTNVTNAPTSGDLTATMKASVNTEVDDALNVTTYAEPGIGTPPATTTLAAKINYLYKNWRNRKTQTATAWSLFNDDATTVDQQSTVSDNGTTADKTEVITG